MLKFLTCTLLFCSFILCGCAQDMTTNLTADTVGADNPSAASDDDSLHVATLSSLSAAHDDSDALSTDAQSTDAQSSDAQSLESSEEHGTSDDHEEAREESTDVADETDVAAGDETEDAAPTTAEEYVAAINEKLQQTDIPGAIASAEEAYAKFPDNEVLLQELTGLLYQSLRFESDETVLNQRRMRLGKLARVWIERNKDSVESLGNMPVLLLEEAKAYLANQDVERAFAAVQQARDLGFKQTIILFYDPLFADLLADEKAKAEIKKWLSEEVEEMVAQTESFPFDFNLSSFAGDQVALSDFTGKGKILIVDFWGTWCPPCRKEIPHFVELIKKRADDVAIVGINIEDPSGAEVDFAAAKASFDKFVQTQPINYPCLAGDRDTLEQVPEFQGYPTTLFLDETGRVRLKLTGYHPLEMLEAAVDLLLKDQTPTG